MVRNNITTEAREATIDKATAQWRAAWSLLRAEVRARVAAFCAAADADVATTVLRMT